MLAALALLVSGAIRHSDYKYTHSDSYAINKSILIKTTKGSCSGEQIEAPSGQNYILTAAHCKELSEDGISFSVITENGDHLQRKIIAEDSVSDLLLLEGIPSMEGLQIAQSVHRKDHVHTFTHGHGYPTYKTEGDLVGLQVITIGIGIEGRAGLDCSAPKYKVIPEFYMGSAVNVCVLYVDEYITTAKVVPGSSGGMVLNADNELVAVVSATDGDFGCLVPLPQIKDFIKGY